MWSQICSSSKHSVGNWWNMQTKVSQADSHNIRYPLYWYIINVWICESCKGSYNSRVDELFIFYWCWSIIDVWFCDSCCKSSIILWHKCHFMQLSLCDTSVNLLMFGFVNSRLNERLIFCRCWYIIDVWFCESCKGS